MDNNTILFFISKTSSSFHVAVQEFQKLIKALASGAFTYKMIDVTKEPEMAEQYKVEVLPTILVGEMRFVGTPNAERLAVIISQGKEDQVFLRNYQPR